MFTLHESSIVTCCQKAQTEMFGLPALTDAAGERIYGRCGRRRCRATSNPDCLWQVCPTCRKLLCPIHDHRSYCPILVSLAGYIVHRSPLGTDVAGVVLQYLLPEGLAIRALGQCVSKYRSRLQRGAATQSDQNDWTNNRLTVKA